MLNIHMARKQDILVRFGKHVRELRKAKGFSQEAFAAHCGLDRTYIGGIERGERNVALRNIEIIARALDLTVSELMEGLDSEGDNG
jgi:transcriptional regulator with XRE-family HTH domain